MEMATTVKVKSVHCNSNPSQKVLEYVRFNYIEYYLTHNILLYISII